MKKFTWILGFILMAGTCLQAQDGIAFWSQQAGWSFDFDGNGTIDKTFNSELPEASNITCGFIGDYNEDGFFDICEVSQAEGNLVTWYFFVNDGSNNFTPEASPMYGVVTDKVLAGDFMGNGKMQVSIRRDNEWGLWWLIHFWGATDDANFQFGIAATDVILAGDLNADGKDDLIAYNNGNWQSTFTPASGFPDGANIDINNLAFGLAGNIPVIADFNGDGHADIGVYDIDDAEIGFNLYSTTKPENNGYSQSGRGSYDETYIVPSGISAPSVCAIKKSSIPPTSGIFSNKIESSNLVVYPNPVNLNTNRNIHIVLPEATLGTSDLVVFNSLGQQVVCLPTVINGTVLNASLPSLTTGTYFIRLSNTKISNATMKLIIK